MLKILIIEDDETISGLLREILNHFDIDYALDLINASEKISNSNFDIIISDYWINDQASFELFKKHKSKIGKTKLVMITSYPTVEIMSEGYELGVERFFRKPFNVDEFKTFINNISGKKNDFFIFGNYIIEINESLREIKLNEEIFSITETQIIMIRHLLNNHNKTISRDELKLTVWNSVMSKTDNNIDSHIATIKKSIPPMRNFIKSIRGVGYVLKIS